MTVIVPLDTECPIKRNKGSVFAEFVLAQAQKALHFVFTEYRSIVEPRLQKLGIQLYDKDLDIFIQDILYVTVSGNTLVLGVKPRFIDGVRIDIALKAIDFGSKLTGTPQRLFTPALLNIRDGRKQLYQNYLRRQK